MARYDQCDATCTTDCGHCKGQGAPVPSRLPRSTTRGEQPTDGGGDGGREVEAVDVAVQRLQALRLQLMQTATAAVAVADVVEQLIVERQDQLALLAEQPGGGK